VRLAISSAGDPVLKLQPSHYCPPRSTAAPGRLTSRDEVMRADEARRLQAAGPYRVNILVNEAGVPAQVVLAQSSGNDRMDAMALEAARTARFVPALLDGVRVPAWYEVGLP
jgi:TonB family protein